MDLHDSCSLLLESDSSESLPIEFASIDAASSPESCGFMGSRPLTRADFGQCHHRPKQLPGSSRTTRLPLRLQLMSSWASLHICQASVASVQEVDFVQKTAGDGPALGRHLSHSLCVLRNHGWGTSAGEPRFVRGRNVAFAISQDTNAPCSLWHFSKSQMIPPGAPLEVVFLGLSSSTTYSHGGRVGSSPPGM